MHFLTINSYIRIYGVDCWHGILLHSTFRIFRVTILSYSSIVQTYRLISALQCAMPALDNNKKVRKKVEHGGLHPWLMVPSIYGRIFLR